MGDDPNNRLPPPPPSPHLLRCTCIMTRPSRLHVHSNVTFRCTCITTCPSPLSFERAPGGLPATTGWPACLQSPGGLPATTGWPARNHRVACLQPPGGLPATTGWPACLPAGGLRASVPVQLSACIHQVACLPACLSGGLPTTFQVACLPVCALVACLPACLPATASRWPACNLKQRRRCPSPATFCMFS